MNLKAEFIQQLRNTFPGLQAKPLEELISDNLISPFSVELPSAVLEQAQKTVALLFSLREKKSYQAHYQSLIDEKGLQDPGNKSIMMSYDFHLDEQQNLRLIEVNTNAAFLALGHQMYAAKGHPLPISDFNLAEIGQNIRNELQLQGKSIPDRELRVAIIDEVPSQQRLFVEFLIYQELFTSFGWKSVIQDYRELFSSTAPDFIYNRYTDFFLTDSSSAPLRQGFLSKEICLSPNPYEYLLLADKQRMIDWLQPNFLESHGLSTEETRLLRTVLPLSFDLSPEKAEEAWAQRKKLFFKPKNAFGSKFSYRGASISRKPFEEMLKEDIIAQEFIPAPERTFITPEGPQNFKFDLRCYAYQGRLQLVLARIYQGQVTNLKTPYGGFATTLFR